MSYDQEKADVKGEVSVGSNGGGPDAKPGPHNPVSNENGADKKSENVEIPEDKASVMQKGNLIIVAIPMDKTPRAMARGLLLEVDDILRQHYAYMEQEKRKSKVQIVPASTGIKGKLAKVFGR